MAARDTRGTGGSASVIARRSVGRGTNVGYWTGEPTLPLLETIASQTIAFGYAFPRRYELDQPIARTLAGEDAGDRSCTLRCPGLTSELKSVRAD